MKRDVSIICLICCSALLFLCEVRKPLVWKYIINDEAILCGNNNGQNDTLQQKEVFLTFDDGPCVNNTKKILKILRDNNVKATFFVVGVKGEENPQILKEINDSGMDIGIHTYSHNYKNVYRNLEFYLNDFQSCKNVINNIIGIDPISYIRLPGGSDNLVASKSNLISIKQKLKEKGIKYVDWNVSAEDAANGTISAEKVKETVIRQCQEKKLAVILMHDTYYGSFTVEALPEIINYLKGEGYLFRTFGELTPAEENIMERIGIVNRA